ncbi:MAG TPA: FKBP-type peptidyl-prolyl cis-trans isomerase [Flavitalea sp.]|nr:FKBP-type peptidyl-prolyl cis-trans isomerase [Flavitalea sp.]
MGIADRLFQLKNEKASANLKAGQDFLEANKKKPGIVTLPSGLQYEIISTGTGAKPSATDTVTCHYHGTLIDGTVFDSSVRRGQPASFPLNKVIKGWTEGLQLMPAGSKWRFFIPAHLAYGERQVSAQIGPNSALIFEVELLGIG